MAGRRRATAGRSAVPSAGRIAAPAFRPSAAPAPGVAPDRRQLVALLAVLILVAAGVAVVSYLVRPSTARSFRLVYGSIFLDDDTSPVAVDLASGKPTVRLTNAFSAVSARSTGDLDVVPLADNNTLMLDPGTGEFNMVDSTGFVVKTSDGGVLLPRVRGATTSRAVPSGANAFIVRGAATSTTVYLVGTSTVASASGSAARARAYASVAAPPADVRSPAASANGALWLLTGAGTGPRRLRELSVPPRSNAGASLRSTVRATVTGAAAVGVATRNPDGTGGDVAALASARAVRVFGTSTGGPRARSVPVDAGPGVDQILAASHAEGRLVFLYHSRDGWSRVDVPTGGGPATASRMSVVGAGASLALPAVSDGTAFTMDVDSGALWQTGEDGRTQAVPGVPTYPFRTNENHALSSPEVVARGGRVVFNSRSNYEAAVVFTDGRRQPRVIDKRSAVEVDPAGATALADAVDTTRQGTAKTDAKTTARPQRRPTQPVNPRITCRTTTQKPHVPVLSAGARAARSITLSWTYTKLDPTDCVPSTYVVSIRTVTAGAPGTGTSVKVQGQLGVVVSTLFPATEYEMRVTAYIGNQSTTSAPIRVTTGPEGPAAPTDVRARTDSRGTWTVSWRSCGGIAQGCVPSTTWNLIPSFCDGRGLSAAPDPVSFAADPTVHTFSKAYAGGDALLGRGLCFQVQGVSPQGTTGDTSKATTATYTWAPPTLAAMRLTASQPATTSFGATATTTAALDLGADPVRTVGGVGATITFTLDGPEGARTKAVTWTSGSRVSAAFPGIAAGARYTVVAKVSPPRHPGNAVTTAPARVSTRANWPAMTADASCPTGGGPVVLSCDLAVRIHGLSSADARGETFSTQGGTVRCGNAAFDITKSTFDPSQATITAPNVNLLQYNGTCDVTTRLVEAGAGTAVFGGSTSPVISTQLDLGRASTLDAARGDFDVRWSGSSIVISYTGARSFNEVAALTLGWRESVLAPDGATQCGAGTAQPTHDGIEVSVGTSCINDQGDHGGWPVQIGYQDSRDGTPHEVDLTEPGAPPDYTPPCVIGSDDFAAAWNSDKDNPAVAVSYQPDGQTDLRGCSAFEYTLAVNATDCGNNTDHAGLDPNNPASVSAGACDLSAVTVAQVTVSYFDQRANGRQTLAPVTVDGSPPS